MTWQRVTKGNPVAVSLADKHYSRQTKGGQVGQPGRCLVLLTTDDKALWVWNWPLPQFARHGFGDRHVCTLFRNESTTLSSKLIAAAEDYATSVWGVPKDGLLTFVNASMVRHKRDPGRCFIRAGWRKIGVTTKGLIVLGKGGNL